MRQFFLGHANGVATPPNCKTNRRNPLIASGATPVMLLPAHKRIVAQMVASGEMCPAKPESELEFGRDDRTRTCVISAPNGARNPYATSR